MKALSVKQPHAALIRMRLKPIETRTWYTEYRGDLLLVSSKKPVHSYVTQCSHCYEFDIFLEPCGEGERGCSFCYKDFKQTAIDTSIGGQSLCLVNLIDCRPMTKADEPKARCRLYDGAFAWVFDEQTIRPIEPFPVKGQLGLYDVNINLEQLKFLEK